MDPNASKNDHIGEQAMSDQQIMQMNQAAAQQILPMNDQAAVQQLMQMNQAAAQQILPMNDQAAAQQFMQMNDQMIMTLEEQQIKIMENKIRERNADVNRYRPLYRAIREKNWKAVDDFINNDLDALHKDITETGENIFHLLSQFDEAIDLVEKFVSKVPPESLERVNIEGSNTLVIAALSGNTKAAKVFVRKHKKLLSIKDMETNFLPVHEAAYCSRKETVEYLISETAEVEDLTDKTGAKLLKILIKSNLFGTALGLLKQYPELARHDRNSSWKSNFGRLARKPQIFASGSRLGFWHSFIYQCIPLHEDKNPYPLPKRVGDIEKQTDRFQSCSAESKTFGFLQPKLGELRHELNIMFWNAVMQLAPSIKRIHDEKQMHTQTLEIIRMMIGDSNNWNYVKAIEFLKEPAFIAARLGIHEVVNEILKAYIGSVSFTDESGHHMLSFAVLHRQEKVFNLVYQVCHPMIRDQLTMWKNDLGDTILHQAGVLAPSSEVPGAALQMQRELQWFKTVEDLFHPSLQRKHDLIGKTPREVFTESHNALVEKGEKWMKDTATSCSVVAALIITIVFTAAFTVPGGIDSHGKPIFFHELSFQIFAISVALALFSSTASVQMFLGILTSRYSEDDFLVSLPKKLIIGLITLFFSIASMMVAFAATFYIVISHPWRWVTFLIASLGAVPVTLFAWMQFPLLVDIFKSTYGPGIYKPIELTDVYM
ncbi:hypothetical protein Ddye_012138 [Dipteronia dyeriana]|uniref:PGG domain-containing protein n=1 Tax=Dipteronia dyeriana TaxID=168575 RepID=A0AAD9X3Y9_9ROSI|nr:hypothetical protein Ddye_012138 [Dipteronia dyeriana]